MNDFEVSNPCVRGGLVARLGRGAVAARRTRAYGEGWEIRAHSRASNESNPCVRGGLETRRATEPRSMVEPVRTGRVW